MAAELGFILAGLCFPRTACFSHPVSTQQLKGNFQNVNKISSDSTSNCTCNRLQTSYLGFPAAVTEPLPASFSPTLTRPRACLPPRDHPLSWSLCPHSLQTGFPWAPFHRPALLRQAILAALSKATQSPPVVSLYRILPSFPLLCSLQ